MAMKKLGISVKASGISVAKDKYYLVNLNADPSLNELLVYYLKVSHGFDYLPRLSEKRDFFCMFSH